MRIAVGQQNYPNRWSLIENILRDAKSTRPLGLTCRPGELHRFGARYRLAKSVERVQLGDGYSDSIARGYTALFQTFLAYTALEQWARVHGHDKVWKLRVDYDEFGNSECAAEVRAVNGFLGVLNFLSEHSDPTLRKSLQYFYLGKGAKVPHIAAAVRHIFAHGIFSSSSGTGSTNDALVQICELSRRFTLEVIHRLYKKAFGAILDEVELRELGEVRTSNDLQVIS